MKERRTGVIWVSNDELEILQRMMGDTVAGPDVRIEGIAVTWLEERETSDE